MMERKDGKMTPSPKIAHLDVINQDERGIGELVVSTLTDDYMPLLNYRIGDLVQPQTDPNGGMTYVLHGRNPDALKTPDGRRVTTRDVDQCFVGSEGLLHYRLHEYTSGSFRLHYIASEEKTADASIQTVVQRLEELLRPSKKIEARPLQYLLPEASGKFVLSYAFAAP
jgi:phenylacetate-coenzyme A ligase PaaK-like adenylate-forming protein